MDSTEKTKSNTSTNKSTSDTDTTMNSENETKESPLSVNGRNVDEAKQHANNTKTGEGNASDPPESQTVTEPEKKADEPQAKSSDPNSADVPKERTMRTRKRKASEMKTLDDSEEASKEKKVNNETAVTENNVTEKPDAQTEKQEADAVKEKVQQPKSTSTVETDKESTESEFGINDDINLPPKQTLGKGKRARIPNKRYSDILLSPQHRTKTENGSDNESVTSVTQEVVTPTPPPVKSSRTSTSSPIQAYKKTRAPTDITNPNFLKPFKYGWKRELVWRATFDSNQKRNGDIYYYTPTGKKVRSMREVSENLKNKELTLDDFTFTKEPIGLNDPEKEIIRDAKYKAGSGMAKKVLSKKAPAPKAKVASPKLASPKVSSPKPSSTPATTSTETAESPKKGKDKNLGNFKIKLPAKKAEKRKSEEDVESEPPPAKQNTSTTSTRRTSKWANNFDSEKPCQPCSIRCPGVPGMVPTLQCRHCLCLYHHECVGAPPHMALTYVCKNCHLDGQSPNLSTPNPQPLTPTNSLKTAQSSTPPKTPRIPRGDDENVEMSNFISRPEIMPNISETSKSLVGSVTTWLPHNSKIIDNFPRNNGESQDTLKPQYLEIIAGRKFLVIPKHNFMTVSPSVGATASRSNSRDSPTPDLGPTNMPMDSASMGPILDNIKTEPNSPSKSEKVHTSEAMEVDMPVKDIELDDENTISKETDSLSKDEIPESTPEVTTPTRAKKRSSRINTVTTTDKTTEGKFMDHYLQNLSFGYSTLLYVFQYLKVQDLLRAGCVCTMWRDIASHPSLWRTVRMKNSQVHSFEGLANTLKKHGTIHLDLRKMLLPSGGDEIWPEFSKAIEKVETLRKIELCRCPAAVVEQLAVSNPHLEVINAVTIKCENMSLEPFASLRAIKELKLKSTSGLTLTSNIDSLKGLITLKNLSLTSIRDLKSLNLSVIAELKNLESLDLGECSEFPQNFGEEILIKLEKLEKLRLEKGQGNCHTFEILEAVKDMKHLEQLELVNFDIKTGFDKALGACSNIKKLLIIPTYISQSATTNHMVLGGVLRLHKTLSHFVWGVTLELLRVTELFVDQCEEPTTKEKKEKKVTGNGDSIPVLKPVPLITEDCEIPPAHDPPQVEILPLPNLQKLLLQSLPTTRVKILKIPFHATWRQSITDSVN
ncbi:uncharacterized protein LOC109595867 isoform X2 [Aethina tumida]|uniref:uncharacterized protein LOC109595867 isoform X2 n=1 Tax=Aethina tumida TaxID=116153 RepID=UPI0021498DD4|nr:uncharacterized protein LOC109595867 isoform X2 [Aethina tumida]